MMAHISSVSPDDRIMKYHTIRPETFDHFVGSIEHTKSLNDCDSRSHPHEKRVNRI